MSELLKCKCGLPPMMFPQTGPKGDYWQVGCPCGRSGRAISSKEEAVAAWNADRLAEEKAREALAEAVDAIYFDDSSDYGKALWDVVIALNQEAADLLESDEKAAFDKFGSGRLEAR